MGILNENPFVTFIGGNILLQDQNTGSRLADHRIIKCSTALNAYLESLIQDWFNDN